MNKLTIHDLISLQAQAWKEPSLPGPQWPPSIYYRYLAIITQKMKPEIFLELGTCGGGASRHVATKNPDVKIISIDVTKLPQVSEITCPNFQFVLGDSIETAKTLGPQHQGKIGIIFIDTIHEYQHTMNEFNAWKSYMTPGGIIFFDDLYRQGMDRVWKELPETKTEFHALSKMHIGGSPTDGGFGAIIL